jgi:hypothetical protein
MDNNLKYTKKDITQRLTAFVDPDLIKRAKVRGALEGLTISEIVQKALDAYAPKIEKSRDHINVKFLNHSAIDSLIPNSGLKSSVIVSKHTKALAVPR